MRLVTVSFVAVLAAAAAPLATAAPSHLSDVQFIAASRCVGLMSSKKLASPDVTAMKKLVNDEDSGRIDYISDRADQARDDAQNQADRASGDELAKLTAERDGVCHSLLASMSTASAGGPERSLQ
jgi:hypothetical protein